MRYHVAANVGRKTSGIVPRALALAMFVACNKAEQPAAPVVPMVTRTDSAGIELVQIAKLDTSALETWEIGPQPITVIGDDARGDAHVFRSVRGPIRMADGRVMVALETEIREFDSTGTFTRNIARKGRGPGEFQDLSAMQRIHGDTLLVYERYPATATFFSPSGEYLRRTTVIRPRANEEVPGTSFKAAFPDGTLLLAQRPPGEHLSKLGVVWADSAKPLHVDITGKLIAEFPKHWDHDVTRVEARAGLTAQNKAHMSSFPAVPRRSVWGVAGNQLYYSVREKFEVELWSADGKLKRIIRMTTRDIPRTPADSDVYRFEGVTFDFAPVATPFVSPIANVESDRDGNLWIMLDKRALEGGAPAVLVLDSTGAPIARTSFKYDPALASKYRLLSNNRDISADAVTTEALDADDRQHVLVFRVRKTPALRSPTAGTR
ncbi:MAG: hypothetical protein ABJB74_18100 [Gemmatimonas sp.]